MYDRTCTCAVPNGNRHPIGCAAHRPTPAVIECNDCHDEGACVNHRRYDAHVRCARCAGTGAFITGFDNGKPTGPGGPCFRCNGKGHHTRADRRRNWGHTRNMRVSANG